MPQIKNPSTQIQVTKQFGSSEELKDFYTKFSKCFISSYTKDKKWDHTSDDCEITFTISSEDMLYMIQSENIKTAPAQERKVA